MWGRTHDYDNGFNCPDRGDYTTYDESVDCSCCQGVYCSECAGAECTECKEKNEDGLCSICESCIDYDGCEACNDDYTTFCKGCISDHLKNCTKTGRAQRIINSESHNIKENEVRIKKLREEISSRETQISILEGQLATSKERKAAAELDLRAESAEEPCQKKQKSTET